MGCVVLLRVLRPARSCPETGTSEAGLRGRDAFVASEAQPGDLITTTDITTEMYRRYYRQDWRAVHNAPELEALRDSVTGKVWMIYTFPRYLALFDSALEAKVDRECHTERVFPATLGGGEVVAARSRWRRGEGIIQIRAQRGNHAAADAGPAPAQPPGVDVVELLVIDESSDNSRMARGRA